MFSNYYIIIKYYYKSEQDEWSPQPAESMEGRKVRALQGKALHNTEWGKPQGKCHRKGNRPGICRDKGEKVR